MHHVNTADRGRYHTNLRVRNTCVSTCVCMCTDCREGGSNQRQLLYGSLCDSCNSIGVIMGPFHHQNAPSIHDLNEKACEMETAPLWPLPSESLPSEGDPEAAVWHWCSGAAFGRPHFEFPAGEGIGTSFLRPPHGSETRQKSGSEYFINPTRWWLSVTVVALMGTILHSQKQVSLDT